MNVYLRLLTLFLFFNNFIDIFALYVKLLKTMANISIFNEDCFKTMDDMRNKGTKVDLVLTSPPYNTSRVVKTQKAFDDYNNRYDIYIDAKTDEEYSEWTLNLFNSIDSILSENGVILYNISYGNERPTMMWNAIANLQLKSNFVIAEQIIWKKSSALPNNVSHNKLTRIVEPVFVFCRKNELSTFNCNKKVKSIRKDTGQKYYENIFNFIEAKNNDGKNPYNNACYSSDLCVKLMNIYAKEDSLVYDPFMGSGTTARACKLMGIDCIGSELSENQCKWAIESLEKMEGDLFSNVKS